MEKFSKKYIEKLFKEAPQIVPELLSELYEVLEKDGVSALNKLMAEKGTFNPHFANKQEAIEFIILMKKISRLPLTLEEEGVLNMISNLN